MKLLKNNWVYILFCGFYITLTWLIFGANLKAFLITTLIYCLSFLIAFSPIGEKILKHINNTRPLKTNDEKDYLLPIFEEVYANALETNSNLSNNITLNIVDEHTVNAFAIGKSIIAVTKGAIDGFSSEELKGVLAHEFGHISNGDTKALLLNFIGNGLFSVFVLLIKGFFWIADRRLELNVKWFVDFLIYSIAFLGQIILSLNSRSNEYGADKFAFDIGYGVELKGALYFLKDFNMSHKMTLKEKLISSHPHIADRIEILENNMN